jgi:hypothetical protein
MFSRKMAGFSNEQLQDFVLLPQCQTGIAFEYVCPSGMMCRLCRVLFAILMKFCPPRMMSEQKPLKHTSQILSFWGHMARENDVQQRASTSNKRVHDGGSHFTETRGAQTAQALAKKRSAWRELSSHKNAQRADRATRNNKCACITSYVGTVVHVT